MTKMTKENKYLENHKNSERETPNYKVNNFNSILEKLQLAPSRIPNLENTIYLMGDCGSCPSCACINADFQALAIIEAPATVPLLVVVGGIKFAS